MNEPTRGAGQSEQPADPPIATLSERLAVPLAHGGAIGPVTVPAPGLTGHGFGPDGAAIWPLQPALEIADPAEPPEELAIAADAWFGTSEGRLLAEGWEPPIPDIRAVLESREALRSAVHRAGTRANPDSGAIHAAIRNADVDGIITAIVGHAVDVYLTAIEGQPESPVQMASAQLEVAWRQLAWRHQRALLVSLAGRTTPAADRLRRGLEALARLQQAPGVTFPDYSIRR